MPFDFKKLDIPGLVLIEPRIFTDTRGSFAELYKYPDFQKFGIDKQFLQINRSASRRGVVRGLHYQKEPAAQGKWVGVMSGKIFDVALDLRKGSPHYGKWIGVNLSSEDQKMIYVPAGFAHGFCALSETADVIYYCTQLFSPEHERGVLWNDPALRIEWPVRKPIVSEKDCQYPTLDKADNNFVYRQ